MLEKGPSLYQTRANNFSDTSQSNFWGDRGGRGSVTFYWLRSPQELAEWDWQESGAMQRHKFLGEAAGAPEISDDSTLWSLHTHHHTPAFPCDSICPIFKMHCAEMKHIYLPLAALSCVVALYIHNFITKYRERRVKPPIV